MNPPQNLVDLPALVGTNPGGLLAALGALDVATRSLPDRKVTLHWRPALLPTAVLSGPDTIGQLIQFVLADRDRWRTSEVLNGFNAFRPTDVKVQPEEVAPWFTRVAEHGTPEDLRLLHALISEGATAGKGDTKPTHLHFSAGNQRFLIMASELRDQLTEEHLEEALVGPWRYESTLPVFGWDNSRGERLFALSARSPSSSKKQGVPGADWLGYLGLQFLPVVSTAKHELLTTGCRPEWKTGGSFSWPLWDAPATAPVVAALLQQRPSTSGTDEAIALGVFDRYQAPIRRADQGGYGSFGPTTPM